MTIKIDKVQRSIRKTVSVDNEGRELALSVSHYKERKEYLVTLIRQELRDNIVSYKIMEDGMRLDSRPAGRYSFKTLEDIFSEFEGQLDNEEHLAWARAKTM